MMCPVCKRDLAPTLSICLTCGAMMNDTVREELETKITTTPELATKPPVRTSPRKPVADRPPKVEAKTATPRPAPPPTIAPPKPIGVRFDTADLRVKKTSPTLVEFQTTKATVPEWRLQLQNSVRQKVGGNRREDATANGNPTAQPTSKTTSGANALKVEFVEEEQPQRHQNPRVASALKRIEESRRTFTNQPVPEQSVQVGKSSAARNFPFNVVARSTESNARQKTVNPSPKPMLVSSLKIEKRGFDTNKLPPLPKSEKISSTLEVPAA